MQIDGVYGAFMAKTAITKQIPTPLAEPHTTSTLTLINQLMMKPPVLL